MIIRLERRCGNRWEHFKKALLSREIAVIFLIYWFFTFSFKRVDCRSFCWRNLLLNIAVSLCRITCVSLTLWVFAFAKYFRWGNIAYFSFNTVAWLRNDIWAKLKFLRNLISLISGGIKIVRNAVITTFLFFIHAYHSYHRLIIHSFKPLLLFNHIKLWFNQFRESTWLFLIFAFRWSCSISL